MELLLVSHKGVASGLKNTAGMVVGEMADNISVVELTAEDGVESFAKNLENFILNWLSDGKTAVIFADLMGGTPFNQTERILLQHNLKNKAKVIAGMNLPMILEALSKEISVWTVDDLNELIEIGREGISCMELQVSSGSDDE